MAGRLLTRCALLLVLLAAGRCRASADAATARLEKRQRERSQFVPYGPYAPREPSCEQLRAMWKLSKRQHRNAVRANAMPRFQEPFLLRRVADTLRRRPLHDPSPPPSQSVFGTLVRGPDEHVNKFETSALDKLLQMTAPARPSADRYTLRQLVQLFGRPGAPPPSAPSGGGDFGRVHHAPLPRGEPADNAVRLEPRKEGATAGRHQRIFDV